MRFLRFWTIRRLVMIPVTAILAWVAVLIFGRYFTLPAPAQPVPFSHHVHVTTKNLNCFFCHPYATRSSNAGIPPVQKCLLCHKVIASRFSPIAKVVQYGAENKPIPWQRVYVVPDFVRFSHQAHLTKRFDCGVCHGNVAQMDRVGLAQKIDMNWCVTCHWRNKGPDSCYTCHY